MHHGRASGGADERIKAVKVDDALRGLFGDAVPEELHVGLRQNEHLLDTLDEIVDDLLQGIFEKQGDVTYLQEPEAIADYLQHAAYLVHCSGGESTVGLAQATPVLRFCEHLVDVLQAEPGHDAAEPLQSAFLKAYVNAYSVLCIALYTAALLTLCRGLQGAERHEARLTRLISTALHRAAVETHVYRVLCSADDASQLSLRETIHPSASTLTTVTQEAFERDRCVPSGALHSAVRRVVCLLSHRDHLSEDTATAPTAASSSGGFAHGASPSRIIVGVLRSRMRFGGVSAFGTLYSLSDPDAVYAERLRQAEAGWADGDADMEGEGPSKEEVLRHLQEAKASHRDFNHFVASHCYFSCESALSGPNAHQDFKRLALNLAHTPHAVQHEFLPFVAGSTPAAPLCFWEPVAEAQPTGFPTYSESQFWGVFGGTLGVDPATLYLFLTARALVLQLEQRRLEVDAMASGAIDTFGHSRLSQAVRAVVVAVSPPVEALLKGIPFWRPKDWDFLAQVTAWALDEEVDRVRRGAAVTAARHPQALATPSRSPAVLAGIGQKWDAIFHAALACPDPPVLEKQMATLIDAVFSAGSVPLQRFLAYGWKPRVASPISATIEPDTANPSASVVTVRLPSVGTQTAKGYAAARQAALSISVCVVTGLSGASGPGIDLKWASGDAELLLGNAVRVSTQEGTDEYKFSVSIVLKECTATEQRPVQLVVGYAGLLPLVLRCVASASNPLQLMPNHRHAVSPVGMLSRLLLAKGDQASIHHLLDGHNLPRYYEVLVQFLVQRMEYRAAARVSYRIVERVRSAPRAGLHHMEAAVSAICLATNLLLAADQPGFCLVGDDPSGGAHTQPAAAAAPHAVPDFVSLDVLAARRCTLEAEVALLKRTQLSPLQLQQRTNSELLDLLVEKSLFIQAARFADARKLSLEPVFTAAATRCVDAEFDGSVSAKTRRNLWAEVHTLLKKYSTESSVWQYHVAVLRVVVGRGGTPSGNIAGPLRVNRPDTIVRVCAEHGSWASLTLALEVAIDYVQWQAQGCKAVGCTDFSPKGTVPVSLLDSLLARCDEALASAAAEDPSSPAALLQAQQLFRAKVARLTELWAAGRATPAQSTAGHALSRQAQTGFSAPFGAPLFVTS